MQPFYKNIILIECFFLEKSHLATKISEILPYQIISIDILRDSFLKIFSEPKIGKNITINNNHFQQFLINYLKNLKLNAQGKNGYIIEGSASSLDIISQNFLNEQNLVYGLGIENIDVIEMEKEIKKNNTLPEWTNNLSQKELKKYVQKKIKQNEIIKEFCKKNHIPFYNIATNREEVLNKILEDIQKKYFFYPTKPSFITKTDWELLQKKYPSELEAVLIRLQDNFPIQYLIGNVDFYNCYIKVNQNVLIPRFETELFTDKLIKRINKLKIFNPNIIDLGTGSGCIAIALKKHLNCQMTSLDISQKALEVAKENAQANGVKIKFVKQDMTKADLQSYDIIISNPPYVKKEEPVGKETKYEPQKALFAKENGLYFYHKILVKIKNLKKLPILIAFEIGMNQAEEIKNLAKKYLSTYKCSIEKDYQNRNRFVFLEKNVE